MSRSPVDLLQSQSEEVEEESRALGDTHVERHRLFGLLSKVTSVLDNVKARINAIAPVSRLPPELLARVFFILRDVQPPRQDSGLICTKDLGWIVITHICGGWRGTAIGCPALWTENTFCLGTQWAECMLSRSQQVPVKIDHFHEKKPLAHVQNAKLIANHLAHTRSLRLATWDASLSSFLQELTVSAPILHTLELWGPGEFAAERDPTLIASIPDDFLGHHFPCLRDLQVRDAFIPWTSPVLRNLRSLDLSLPIIAQRPAHWNPTLSQFVDALEQMPDLTKLSAAGVLPTFSRDMFSPVERRVALPYLIVLSLGGDTLDVALIMSRIIAPPNVCLFLSCTSCDDPNQAAILFRVISDHIGTAYSMSATKLYVSGGDEFEILAMETCPSASYEWLTVCFERSNNNIELLQQFLIILPQLRISNFKIHHIPLFSQREWQRVFGHESMASVKSVAIRAPPNSLQAFAKFLSPEPVASVPKLRLLKYINMDFHGVQPWLNHLRKVLKKRKEIGAPLRNIDFYRCSSLDEEWVGQLEDVVRSVFVSDELPSDTESWDGESDGCSDDDLDGPLDDRLREAPDDGR